jgi:hypothetical protein
MFVCQGSLIYRWFARFYATMLSTSNISPQLEKTQPSILLYLYWEWTNDQHRLYFIPRRQTKELIILLHKKGLVACQWSKQAFKRIVYYSTGCISYRRQPKDLIDLFCRTKNCLTACQWSRPSKGLCTTVHGNMPSSSDGNPIPHIKGWNAGYML